MRLCDTHTHLCDHLFEKDIEEVILNAHRAGVEGIISVSENIPDAERNILLAEKFPGIFAGAGLYPTYVDLDLADEMICFIRDNVESLICIGEVGLDYWKVQEERKSQIMRDIFTRFILLSKELQLPLNVHSRSAGKDTIKLLIENDAQNVQLHAFDGRFSTAKPAIEAGYYFSIPASIIRSKQKQKLLWHLPLSSILLETDSPVLSPEPGERNEPSNLIIALEEVVRIKQIDKSDVASIVNENFHKLYNV